VTSEAAWAAIRAELLRCRRSPATVRTARYAWFSWTRFLGRKRLERVTERDLDRYLARRPLAAASRHTYASVIVACYTRLVDAGRLRHNPLARFVLPPVADGRPRDLDSETIAELLRVAARDERDMLVLLLAWGAGLRIGSIAKARTEDVDLRGQGAMFVRYKGGRTGTVPLAEPVAAFLRGYLAGRPRSGPLVDNRGDGRAGQHLCSNHIGVLLRQLLREVGSPARPHDLRHSFATALLRADEGRNLRAVSKLMLHSSIRSTERYTAGYEADALAAIRLLPDLRS
jgi:integrase/recombinase XerD